MANDFGYVVGQTFFNIANSTLYAWNGTAFVVAVPGAAGGSVTSVTFTGDGVVDSSTPSSAVTTAGTVTATIKNQNANIVLAGPTTGSAAAPTFRSLVAADLPVVPAMVQIAQVVTAASATNITFSAIPATYSSLTIRGQGLTNASSVADVISLQFNADTGANYSDSYILGGTTAVVAEKDNAATSAIAAAIGGSFGAGTYATQFEIQIVNYVGTTFTKCFVSTSFRPNASGITANMDTFIVSGVWGSTAAITSIKIFPVTGTAFVNGTTATLYGIL